MTTKNTRKPSKAALEARDQLAKIDPAAAAQLGEAFTVEAVQRATLQALATATAQAPRMVALNTRVEETLKLRAINRARAQGITLQALVADALAAYLTPSE